MPEEAPKVQNKWLLVTALGLGLLVVILFNFYVSRVRAEARGETTVVFQYARTLSPGEEIRRKDLKPVAIPSWIASQLPNIVKGVRNAEGGWDPEGGLISGERNEKNAQVNSVVSKDDFVYWTDTTKEARDMPSDKITPGMVARAVPIDPRESPGEILRVGDRVRLSGRFALRGKGTRAYPILDGVRVLTVGGKYVSEDPSMARFSGNEGQRSYRSITVEVDEKEAMKLTDVVAQVVGDVVLEIRNRNAKMPPNAGKINPDLEPLWTGVGGGSTRTDRYAPPTER